MIYLANTTTAQTLSIPKSIDAQGSLSLTLKNTTELVYVVDDVTDLGTSRLYFVVAVSLPEGISDGEYEYSLADGANVLSTGVLRVGSLSYSPEEYNKSITYEQYDTE